MSQIDERLGVELKADGSMCVGGKTAPALEAFKKDGTISFIGLTLTQWRKTNELVERLAAFYRI